jgi:hypothetical protein
MSCSPRIPAGPARPSFEGLSSKASEPSSDKNVGAVAICHRSQRSDRNLTTELEKEASKHAPSAVAPGRPSYLDVREMRVRVPSLPLPRPSACDTHASGVLAVMIRRGRNRTGSWHKSLRRSETGAAASRSPPQLVSTGRPARRHSGRPTSRRRAFSPRPCSRRTASSA